MAAASLWERAAQAARDRDDWDGAVEHAGRARELYAALGEDRAVARANALAGNALRRAGRLTEARALLTEALRVLRTDLDADTVFAVGQLASLELFAGSSAEAEQLSTEAVILAQAVGVGPGLLAGQFVGLGFARDVRQQTRRGNLLLRVRAAPRRTSR